MEELKDVLLPFLLYIRLCDTFPMTATFVFWRIWPQKLIDCVTSGSITNHARINMRDLTDTAYVEPIVEECMFAATFHTLYKMRFRGGSFNACTLCACCANCLNAGQRRCGVAVCNDPIAENVSHIAARPGFRTLHRHFHLRIPLMSPPAQILFSPPLSTISAVVLVAPSFIILLVPVISFSSTLHELV